MFKGVSNNIKRGECLNEGDVIKGISFDKVKEVVQSTLLLFNVIVPLFIYIFSSEMKGNYKACVFEV